jgi:hypothetical protein
VSGYIPGDHRQWKRGLGNPDPAIHESALSARDHDRAQTHESAWVGSPGSPGFYIETYGFDTVNLVEDDWRRELLVGLCLIAASAIVYLAAVPK